MSATESSSRRQAGGVAKQPSPSGELQRRMDAIIASGVLRKVSKAAVIVLLQARQWAGFRDCTVKLSLRKTASATRQSLTGTHRAVGQLVEAGVLVKDREVPGKYTVYRIACPLLPRRPATPLLDRGRKPWATK